MRVFKHANADVRHCVVTHVFLLQHICIHPSTVLLHSGECLGGPQGQPEAFNLPRTVGIGSLSIPSSPLAHPHLPRICLGGPQAQPESFLLPRTVRIGSLAIPSSPVAYPHLPRIRICLRICFASLPSCRERSELEACHLAENGQNWKPKDSREQCVQTLSQLNVSRRRCMQWPKDNLLIQYSGSHNQGAMNVVSWDYNIVRAWSTIPFSIMS